MLLVNQIRDSLTHHLCEQCWFPHPTAASEMGKYLHCICGIIIQCPLCEPESLVQSCKRHPEKLLCWRERCAVCEKLCCMELCGLEICEDMETRMCAKCRFFYS